ncbi:MAG: PilN domain-containing protein, partial [Acidobacteriota bacterium]
GRALSNNLIADYIFNLEESPYFQNIELISSTQRRERNDQFLEFALTLNYIFNQALNVQDTGDPKRRKR